MKQPVVWDRRRFLQIAGSASLLGSAKFGWATVTGQAPRSARFAYIGAADAIHVYAMAADGCFLLQQTVASSRPVAMAISGGHLYVANGVSAYDKLPRGSVEAYSVDAASGRLKFNNRVPLSLSAILPQDLAIAPGGRSMAVAVHGGGAYNVLPIHEDGQLGAVSGIFKETGSGPHPSQSVAHPSAVIFDGLGRLLTADLGSDKLRVFSLSNGQLRAAACFQAPAGSGPSGIVLHPDGKLLYVAHALNGTICSFAYDGTLEQRETVSVGSEMSALAVHPSGEMLYGAHADGVQAWKIAANGGMEPSTRLDGFRAKKLQTMKDGRSLVALSGDAVFMMQTDEAGHFMSRPFKLASLANPVSIAAL